MAKKQILLDDETKRRITEKAKLSKEECFALDAYIVSTLPMTEKKYIAYSMSRKNQPTTNAASLEQLVFRWFKKDGVNYYIQDREIELFGTKREKDKDGNIKINEDVSRSKEDTLYELNELATSTTDAKLKGDLLMKIADLQQWKKKEETDEASQIKYYLPFKCSKCTLYNNAKMSQMKK